MVLYTRIIFSFMRVDLFFNRRILFLVLQRRDKSSIHDLDFPLFSGTSFLRYLDYFASGDLWKPLSYHEFHTGQAMQALNASKRSKLNRNPLPPKHL